MARLLWRAGYAALAMARWLVALVMPRLLWRACYGALVIENVPGKSKGIFTLQMFREKKQGNFHLVNVQGRNKGQGNIQLSFPAGFLFSQKHKQKNPSKLTGEERNCKNDLHQLYTACNPP